MVTTTYLAWCSHRERCVTIHRLELYVYTVLTIYNWTNAYIKLKVVRSTNSTWLQTCTNTNV